jgi:hypothetical protein
MVRKMRHQRELSYGLLKMHLFIFNSKVKVVES